MPLAGFEPTIPVFKRAKTFHALHRAATVTGPSNSLPTINYSTLQCDLLLASLNKLQINIKHAQFSTLGVYVLSPHAQEV
jgi:hypothetical protein